MEIDALISAVFNCWTSKGNPYLTSIIEEYNNTTNDHCVDGDVTIWTTRPASPLAPLAIKKVSDMLGEASDLLRWHIRNIS
jgi:hypothetical protein